MRKLIYNKCLDVSLGLYFLLIAIPMQVLLAAGENPTGSGQNPSGDGILSNPLKSESISQFLIAIIDVLLTFAVPIIVFFIIFAGFKFVTARGNEGQITEARTALTWAVVGGVIILASKLIINVIQGTVSAL